MHRYALEIGDDLERAMVQLAATRRTTKAEVIRRAQLVRETSEPGRKLTITDAAGRVVKDVVLP